MPRAARHPRLPEPLDLRRTHRYALKKRKSKVDAAMLARVPRPGMRLDIFLRSLPNVLAARDLRRAAAEIAARHRAGRRVILGMGAHPIKVGLSPLVIDLMRRRIVNAVAMNGAAIIHDFELAYQGQTSEDVAAALQEGSFGMAEDTARFLNEAVAARPHEGLGAAVGRAIAAARLAHPELSILGAGARLGVPVTVHVAIGTDIVHMHPSADGAAIGLASFTDFRRLATLVTELDRGVFINLGSAVILPEVFLKALNLARNVGARVGRLLTLDMDFVRHYRPQVNVVERPTLGGGIGFHLTGHHEIMFPLLCAAVLDAARKH